MKELRRAAVAGTWYPSDRDVLAREVDRYLEAADVAPSGEPIAIVAPHAGMMYSGPIAAYAYNLLRGQPIDVAVLVGPSHFVGFEGVAVYERGAFETPFGSKTFADVAPGKNAYQSFGTRATEIEAGEVTVTVTDADGVTDTVTAEYAARSCG